jgi:hypothetical protein
MPTSGVDHLGRTDPRRSRGTELILNGIMLLWFIEVAFSVVFVAFDIRRTPESPVLKWGFVIVALFTGPIGLLLYILACREPMPGVHEDYVRARWRQVVGSTMHCVAGDGIGIFVAAAVLSPLGLPEWVNLLGEYGLGFLFGWTIFQALFMRAMAGGSYPRSLRMTFLPEFVSMNGLMAGMIALSVPWRQAVGTLGTPTHPAFWFILSLSLTLGFFVTYPLNWWLVSAGLKHGMMTVQPGGQPAPLAAGLALAGAAINRAHDRPAGASPPTSSHVPHSQSAPSHGASSERHDARPSKSTAKARTEDKARMILVSLILFSIGVTVAGTVGSLTVR